MIIILLTLEHLEISSRSTQIHPPNAYEHDLTLIGTRPCSDFIDIRPRVKDYTPASETDSPFEYDFRDFSQGGDTVPNVLVS